MSKVIPDGSKIASCRKERDLSQEALAHEAGMCERMLRDVERRNRPLRQTMLRNLATALGKPLDELIDKEANKDEKQERFDWINLPTPRKPNQILLNLVEDGVSLWTWSYHSATMSWRLKVNKIEAEAAALMEEVLKLASRWVNKGIENAAFPDEEWDRLKTDDYDQNHAYPDLFRLARLNEVLWQLKERGINTLANRYVYRYRADEDDEQSELREQARLLIAFYPESTINAVVQIDPGILPPEDPDADEFPF